MRVDHTVLFAVCWLAGCGGARTPSPVTELIGEVTLHEFDDWTHAWAGFVARGVATSDVSSDSIFRLPAPPSVQMGPCEVARGPICRIPCDAQSYCLADDQCSPYPVRVFVDVGRIDVDGGTGPLAPMTMQYDAANGLYDSTPPPGQGLLFAGGEPLDVAIAGGAAMPAVRGTIRAPERLALSAPSLQPFRAPTSGPLAFVWEPGIAEFIEILLEGSSNVDPTHFTSIHCLVADDGRFDLPAEVLATLPAPPRALHLEVTRNAEAIVAAGGTRGVLMHAGFTAAANDVDP